MFGPIIPTRRNLMHLRRDMRRRRPFLLPSIIKGDTIRMVWHKEIAHWGGEVIFYDSLQLV